MEDYTRYMPGALATAGVFLQWVRQFNRVHDVWSVGVIPALLAAAAWALTTSFGASPWRQHVLEFLVAWPGYTAAVIGGTMGAARLAAGGVAVIPVTNSKE